MNIIKIENTDFRVLHVVDVMSPSSGVATVIMNCVTGIEGINQDVAVYTSCDCNMKSIVQSHGGEVFHLPDVKQSFGRKFYKGIRSLLKEREYRVVHGHLMNSAFLYLNEAKRQGVQHRIIHAHSAQMSDTALKRITNKVLSLGIPLWANEYIAVSPIAAKQFFRKVKSVNIISNGIDTELFKFNQSMREEVRKELGIPDEMLCVGHVARFSPMKNHEFLIDIFHELLKQVNSVLILIGDGILESTIKKRVQSKGLVESVKFLGLRQDVQRLYQAFDVFMLPSHSEGFGLVAVEAQCSGLPCLVSENVPKTVVCGDNIRFMPINNPSEWVNAVTSLIDHKRKDGSNGVYAAGLYKGSLCEQIQNIYESFQNRRWRKDVCG